MPSLEGILEEFQTVGDEVRLALLLKYAELLPPLPAALHPLRDAGLNMVDECELPVFLKVSIHNGCARIFADAPADAPTVRSFASILVHAFDGKPPMLVLDAPADILYPLGLARLLGMQRARGLRALYQRLRYEISSQCS